MGRSQDTVNYKHRVIINDLYTFTNVLPPKKRVSYSQQ